MSVAFLQLEPTTRCNFTCGFCAGRHMPQEDLSWEVFEQALETFTAVRHVELQGEGESLMHPRFHDMVAALRARDIAVSFISNGSLLTSTHRDRLLEAGIDKISISIESPDEQAFKRIRGGKLSKVATNLEAFMARKAELGLTKPVIGLSITVLQSTRRQLGEILALYDRLGLDGGVTLQGLQEMPSYAQHYDPEVAAEALTQAQADSVMMRWWSDGRVRRVNASAAPVPGYYGELFDDWQPAQGRCPYLDRSVYVHRNGQVTACCMIKDTDRHALGRLGETSVDAMDAARNAMRADLAAKRVPEPCEGCAFAKMATMTQPQLWWFGTRAAVDRLLGW